jgi:hypothetical protein
MGRTQRVSGRGAAPVVRLSKICDYLADKLCVPMLSEQWAGFKKKVNGQPIRFPIWESPGSPAKGPAFAKNAIGWPPASGCNKLQGIRSVPLRVSIEEATSAWTLAGMRDNITNRRVVSFSIDNAGDCSGGCSAS